MSIKIDSDNLKEGLLGLVMALVEILKEVLQKQAVYRLESGNLGNQEAEKLGQAFIILDEAIEKIKKENGLEKTTNKIRNELDSIVDDTITKLINPITLENVK
ncbi:MAG: gas vesicle protein GvpK [Nanoarchaeota archaeon]|nr:gas vesicle protein GvpK [Nanoarchaeota archaeon]